jgi:hypothetical protein
MYLRQYKLANFEDYLFNKEPRNSYKKPKWVKLYTKGLQDNPRFTQLSVKARGALFFCIVSCANTEGQLAPHPIGHVQSSYLKWAFGADSEEELDEIILELLKWGWLEEDIVEVEGEDNYVTNSL